MPTSRVGLYSEAADGSGTDRIPLAALGRPSGIRITTTYPGGDDTLTANLELDPRTQHRALVTGRYLRASLAGATIWQGILDTPVPGQPWALSATGFGSLGSRFCVDNVSGITTNANVDAKISAGLPWKRTTSLPDPPRPATLSIVHVSDDLNAAAVSANQQWQVAVDGTISFGSPPTTPGYLLLANDRPPRTSDGWVTTLFGLYIDSGTLVNTLVQATSTTAFGVREDSVDLTAFGPISATTAQGYVNTLIGRAGYRARYANAFTVQPGRLLLYPGGAAKDLATVRAGVMVRPTGVDPSQLAETAVGQGAADFVIGQTTYDDDSGVLELMPFEDARQTADLQSLVADLVKQAA